MTCCRRFIDYVFEQVSFHRLPQLRAGHPLYCQVLLPAQNVLHLPHPLFQKESLDSVGVDRGKMPFALIACKSMSTLQHPHNLTFRQELLQSAGVNREYVRPALL
jgi:hypothetical protein